MVMSFAKECPRVQFSRFEVVYMRERHRREKGARQTSLLSLEKNTATARNRLKRRQGHLGY